MEKHQNLCQNKRLSGDKKLPKFVPDISQWSDKESIQVDLSHFHRS